MICYATHTLSEYLESLAAHEPVPGGGSAAALSAAMGASLLVMSMRYSIGKGKSKVIDQRFEKAMVSAEQARALFLTMISSDAQAYLDVVSARKSGDKAVLRVANREAAKVPVQLIKVCKVQLKQIPFLKKEANRYLISDVIAAEIFLTAGLKAAQAMVEANQ